MFFAVIAKDHPGKTDLRAQTKARHSAHLDAAAEELRVLQTGPLLDEGGAEVGSLLILEAVGLATVENFMAVDPYAQAGLFAQVDCKRVWQPACWQLAAASSARWRRGCAA